jgi:hypothetical protein
MKNPLMLTVFLPLLLAGCADDRPDNVVDDPDSSAASIAAADRDVAAGGIEHGALYSMDDSVLLGKEVVSAGDEALGEVDSVVRDPIDQRRMIVIALSGVAGNALKEVAVPIERLRVSIRDKRKLETDLTRAQLEAMPDYDEDGMVGKKSS